MYGERLKRLRHTRGLSARQLAERVGISLKYVYDIEAERYSPSLATLTAIVEALGVSLAWLFMPETSLLERIGANLLDLPEEDLRFLGTPAAKDYLVVMHELSQQDITPQDVRDLAHAARFILERSRARDQT